MSPTLSYYLGLFTLVIFIRFFRVRRDKPNKTDRKIWDYFLIAQEIVYTSAGIFILMLEKEKIWVGLIVIIYVILVFASSAMDGLNQDSEYKLISLFNPIIVVLVVVGAILCFQVYMPNLEQKEVIKEQSTFDSLYQYKVALPFYDNTLKKHVGQERLGKRMLMYFTEINTNRAINPVDSAKKEFYESSVSNPIITDVKGVDEKIVINEDKIVIYQNIIITPKKK